MAQATTLKFGKQYVLIGDAASPEVFSAPCGFEQLEMSINIESSTVNIPDCSDPDLAAWLATDEVSRQMVLTGSGVLATEALVVWRSWWLDGGEKNVRWTTLTGVVETNGYYAGPASLTSFSETGQRGQRWTNSVAIAINGKPTFTAVAP